MNYTDDYLSKMLPGFEKQPEIENSTSAGPAELEENDLGLEPVGQPTEEDQAPEPPEMVNEIVSFLRRYLVCDDHQLTLLALWSLHTWCYACFYTTPYLDVRSPAPQSGKSICLRLLLELCASPAFVRGADARTLMGRLLKSDRVLGNLEEDDLDSLTRTLFLDDCHQTFSSAERQPILALFNSSSEITSCYPSGRSDYYLFGPKAFAGRARLPQSLADRCIPIVLQRRKPSDSVARFNPIDVRATGVKLACWMDDWARANSGALVQVSESAAPQLPSNLTPAQQDCADPLLHIADRIGGAWPRKARTAVAAVFNVPQSSISLQLLGDIRAIFHSRNNPDHLSTRDILAMLIALEYRPWSVWTAKSGQKLATLLRDFDICSRTLHYGDAPTFRGYLRESFEDAWERYLPPLTICSGTETAFEPRLEVVNS
jgi:hypothetical protein